MSSEKKKNSDGTYPLAVRITIDRKTTYIYLGYNLLETDWDSVGQRVRKSHPNSTRLNNLLLKKKAETSDGLIDLQSHDNTVSLKNVRTKIKPSGGVSFFSQGKAIYRKQENCWKV